MPAYGPSMMEQPSERFLYGDPADMKKLRSAPYDAKKNCWVPDAQEVFIEAEIKAKKGDQVTVTTRTGNTITVKASQIQDMNPPKFACAEDMVNMTFLNEASVINNLRTRYVNTLIYTYSGLFCVVINPFMRLPIYGENVVKIYRGKRKQEVPPHLFSVADGAYMNMRGERVCQSMLITGESGAGKTENTKKVIAYFATVGASQTAGEADPSAKKVTLEDQIVQTNPVLEAFGNAKTVRNNNSSRFGKFIRIHFDQKGILAGGDIETYLLEKSRVIKQLPGMERGYHIFFQLSSNGVPGTTDRLLLKKDPSFYRFVKEGVYDVAGLDDGEEFRATDEAFDILNFAADEKENIYKMCAAILWFGNSRFAQRGEQGELESIEEMQKVGRLFGIDADEFGNAICKPRVKVGAEFVTKGQTADQCMNAVGALSKSVYDRVFRFIVQKCNQTLETDKERAYFIGVLDIAGFEIFELNSFEQLCINYTNEKLQQFFNHHMFVQEQEEYKQEQIEWEFVDFGMDLQACLDLIEKKMGILSMLEEECVMPKASDKTYLDKMNGQHLGKNPKYGKPKPSKKKYEAHFELGHYAGPVGYNVTAWLEKNKDPVNETAVKVFKASKNALLSHIWSDYLTAEEQAEQKGGKKKKGGSFMTVSAVHREQLDHLMHTLHETYPHFVRCIIPNEVKTGGIIDGPLVYNQLTCNGVLEGIRICQKGFPNKQIFSDLVERYRILAASVFADGTFIEGKEASRLLLEATGLPKASYGIGLTKVFFKAGTLAKLEELREDKINATITGIQSVIRGRKQRQIFEKLYAGRQACDIIQRNIRSFFKLRHDGWYKMYGAIKPQLTGAKAEEMLEVKTKELEEASKALETKRKQRDVLEKQINDILAEKEDIQNLLSSEGSVVREAAEERVRILGKEFNELQSEHKELEEHWEDISESSKTLQIGRDRAQAEVDKMKKKIEDLEQKLSEHEKSKQGEEESLREKEDVVANNQDKIAHLLKEKKRLEELNAQTLDDLAAEEEKASQLSKLKIRLEQTLDDLEDDLAHERRIVMEVEKVKLRVTNDLQRVLDDIQETENLKMELEEKFKKKEFELNAAHSATEDESGQASVLTKKFKEMQRIISELEDDMEVERSARVKAERARADLQRELDDVEGKLEETSGLSQNEADKNKRREQDLLKIRRDLEETLATQDAEVSLLRKKHSDVLAEMSDQLDDLQKGKNKAEKDRDSLRREAEDLNITFEALSKQKLQLEKANKHLESTFISVTVKIEEHTHIISELQSFKTRLTAENAELTRRLEESESTVNALRRNESILKSQVEEAKRSLDEEIKAKNNTMAQLRSVQAELLRFQEAIEEEQESRAGMQRELSKLNAEVLMWKNKYESEVSGKMEESEEIKRKMALRLAEAEEALDAANARCLSLDKTRMRLAAEVEDFHVEVEKAHTLASQLEKKQTLVDRQIIEWKTKSEELSITLERSQVESRTHQAEMLKLRSMIEEISEAIEIQRKESRVLHQDCSDLQDQLSGSGRAVSETEKAKRRLEVELEDLRSALDEAEGALEIEQGKVVRIQLELTQLKSDIDRRLSEKEEEFESTIKMHHRTIEQMNEQVDVESRGRAEALRQNNVLSGQLGELEINLEGATRANNDAKKLLAKLHTQLQELQMTLDETSRMRSDMRDQVGLKDRYCSTIQSEIEEVRRLLEDADRARKLADASLSESHDRVSELTTQTSGLVTQRRKLEGDLDTLRAELEEYINELRVTEEKSKRAVSDAGRMAEELRTEQDQNQHMLKVKHNLEMTFKDLQQQLEEAEQSALKGGKRALAKVEERIRELEMQLSIIQKQHQDDVKALRKNDRSLKEFAAQDDENKKNQIRLQDLIEKLQSKIKMYKRQVEEAESSAGQSLSKYRHAQHELEDAVERMEMAEASLNKMRSRTTETHVVTRRHVGSGVRSAAPSAHFSGGHSAHYTSGGGGGAHYTSGGGAHLSIGGGSSSSTHTSRQVYGDEGAGGTTVVRRTVTRTTRRVVTSSDED
ncbi:myosin-16-like isoform X2 [Branchiostoma floridae]|uniref:Myosin-16-like isoform X2 n=1 Tax=Branchiostoma floridae TaxID=7739 RepID=A0A9J7LSN3_BRAFL|nr:myosin-16-like isoform X2 [Branchiostoma floridae]